MALTGTNRGGNSNNTSSTTFTLITAQSLAAGSLAVLCVAVDNSATSGNAHSTFTVTDTLGNTWTRRAAALIDPGAANAGHEGAIFTTPQDGGTIVSGTTITVTFGTAATAKTMTLTEVSGTAGTPTFVTSGVGTGGTGTTSPTITTGSIPDGDMVIAALFLEAGVTQTITQDSDTTNGSWSTQQTFEIGSTTSGSNIASQFKVVTATGTQTYNPTLGLAGDLCLAWVQITGIVTKEQHAQAQAYIKATERGYGQARALSGTPYALAVLEDSPAGYWRLGELSGNPQDSSGNNNHVTTVVGTFTYGSNGAIAGDPNTALQFDGDDYLSIPDHSTLDFGDTFTIECWARHPTAAGIQALVSKGQGGYYLRINNDFLELARSNTAIIATSTSVVPVDANYHHLVATKNGAEVKLYIDGVDVTGTINNSTIVNTSDPLFIGSDRAVEFHNNRIDEVAVYPTVLSPTRVSVHYDTGTGGSSVRAHGQARSIVKQTYFGLGQSNADILATDNKHGQAQGTVLTTNYQSGQAQSQIKQTYTQTGQSQAYIKAIGINSFGQSQGTILQVYTQTAQAQGTILTRYAQYGQANATIQATYNAYGQTQAIIKQIGTPSGQSQGWIKVIDVTRQGQTQALIKTLYNVHGQAQSKINSFDYNQHGQSQGYISGSPTQSGQAQSYIKSTVFGLGQGQSTILTVYNTHGQAQSSILTTNNVHGQAQAQVKRTYTESGQAQSQVLQTYTQIGQSQAEIKTTYTVLAQAQASIKTIYASHGQAQAQIKAIGAVHGQTQSQIKQIYFGNGQTQSSIKTTNNSFGQSMAHIYIPQIAVPIADISNDRWIRVVI